MKLDETMIETEKTHELIFDGRVLHLYRDEVGLPGGGTSVREYCRHGGAVAIVPLTDDGRVICVRQYRYAIGRFTLEIPAGKLEGKDPDPLEAARRELREETGYTAGRMIPIGDFLSSPAILTENIRLFLARDLIPGPTEFDEDEFLEILEIPLPELVDRILAGEIADAKTMAAVLKVNEMLRRENELGK